MKVLFLDTVHPFLKQGLLEKNYQITEKYNCSIDELENIIGDYNGIVIRSRFKLTKDILSKASQLKFIARVGAGMENIDVTFAESIGIKCLHAPEGNMDAVGEHALGMLLSLLNNIVRADSEVRKGLWKREFNRGTELMGKTVGLIGFGNMGSAFAKRLSGFDVKIIAYDKYKKNYSTDTVNEATLQQIFDEADVLSFHVPLTEETNYMFDEKFISSFRKPFYLINTARGKVVKTAALTEGIRSGKVLGACLDVLEYEAGSFENLTNIPSPLRELFESDKTIFTPHVGGWSFESNEKLARILVEKISRV